MEVSAAGISAFQQAQLKDEVGLRMLKKTLDASKAQGDAAVSLLQQAADLSQQIVAEPGKGQNIDLYG